MVFCEELVVFMVVRVAGSLTWLFDDYNVSGRGQRQFDTCRGRVFNLKRELD